MTLLSVRSRLWRHRSFILTFIVFSVCLIEPAFANPFARPIAKIRQLGEYLKLLGAGVAFLSLVCAGVSFLGGMNPPWRWLMMIGVGGAIIGAAGQLSQFFFS